jgi:hypothetical protein
LWRARAWSAAAVLTLALGIAGTTVMFTLVQGVLLRPLPVRDQRSLLVAWRENPTAAVAHWPFDARQLDALGRGSRVLERVAGASYYGAGSGVVFENGTASYLSATSVTGDFFDVLGVSPVLGRALRPADDRTGAENVLVIAHGLWQRRYGGAQDALGRRLQIGNQAFTIVGVLPPDIGYPRGAEAWMTLAASASIEMNPAFREGVLRDVDLVARLRPGATLEQARSELAGWVTRLEAQDSADSLRGARPGRALVCGRRRGRRADRDARAVRAVVLVLLIASANVANLLLLRGETRRLELAMRATLGAGRGRLSRQLLAESLLLSLLAGALAFGASGFLLRAVVGLVPGGLPRLESVRVDPLVALFALGTVLLAAALAGMAPVAFLSRIDLAAQLQGARAVGASSGARRGRRGLVVAQIALAVTIVRPPGCWRAACYGSRWPRWAWPPTGWCSSKWRRCRRSRHGLPDPTTRFTRRSWRSSRRWESKERRRSTLRLSPAPAAGTCRCSPRKGQGLESVEKNPALNLEAVHAGYFSTFAVPLLRGRAFTRDDRSGAPDVAIVSEDLAARTWPGQDPIGKRVKFGRPDSKEAWRTVVGVVRPTRYRELAEPRPTLYLPASQFIDEAHILVLRSALPLARVAELARASVRAVDPSLQVDARDALRGARRRAARAAALQRVPDRRLRRCGAAARGGRALRRDGRPRAPALLELGVRMALGRTAATCAASCSAKASGSRPWGCRLGLAGGDRGGPRAARPALRRPAARSARARGRRPCCSPSSRRSPCYLPAGARRRLDPLVVLRALLRRRRAPRLTGIGRSTFQTFSATRRSPSAVGWMPSGWLSCGSPATPSSRNGRSTAPFAFASSG